MGVGPELCLRLAAQGELEGVVLVGRLRALEAANAQGLALRPIEDLDQLPGRGLPVWDPGDHSEPTEVAAIRLATRACLEGRAAALITGPIHKKRLMDQGFAFAGHTEFLGELCGVDSPVMAFTGGELRVALVTTHLPLAQVPAAITRRAVAHTARTAAAALRQDLGLASPRLGVCGLNPHAGEGGKLGQEEIDEIGPACEDLRAEGCGVIGPISAETAFLMGRTGELDLIVAMYHDQGLAPLKAVDFGRSVNWTLGLPILRTSVDHGTADHLVGTGRADPSSLRAAISLARNIIAHRLPYTSQGEAQTKKHPISGGGNARSL